MPNTEVRIAIEGTLAEAITRRGEHSRPGKAVHPTQDERSVWVDACLERLEGKALREAFYERLEHISPSS
jgi:multidrug resistance efflux pump